MATIGAPSQTSGLTSTSIAYSIIITLYTSFVLFLLCILWYHRGTSAIRIRGFLITAIAVIGIHGFVATLWIVYPLSKNGLFSCNDEFWIMSTVFPLGIALFQASNVRLMAYATAQRCLIDLHTWSDRKQPFSFRPRAFAKWFKQLDYVRRTYFCIGMGVVAQLLLTAILFHGSRRFNPTGGWFGEHVDELTCRRGAEWIPSVIWQFLWAWLFGPLVLYKARKIQDTHYWALQTRLAVISGLPGASLWLAFLYSNYNDFNAYWLPAMWFAPGLMILQTTTLIMPLLDIYRNDRSNHKRTLSLVSTTSTYLSTTTTNTSTSTSTRKSKTIANDYDAFEYTLKHNIQPLFIFAATKDFTSENIQFLREVGEFKKVWSLHTSYPDDEIVVETMAARKRQLFEHAARIYFELVCPTTSRCYINVDSKIYAGLEQTFSSLTYEPPVEFRARRSRSQSRIKSRMQKLRNAADVAPWTSPVHSAANVDNTGRMSPIALFDLGGLATKDDNDEEKEMQSAVTITTLRSSNSFNSISRSTSNANLLLTNSAPFSGANTNNNNNNRHGTITPRTFAQPLSLAALYVPPGFDVTVFDKAEESVKYLVYTNTWKSFVGVMSHEVAAVLEGEVVRNRAVGERREGVSRGCGDSGGSDEMVSSGQPSA